VWILLSLDRKRAEFNIPSSLRAKRRHLTTFCAQGWGIDPCLSGAGKIEPEVPGFK